MVVSANLYKKATTIMANNRRLRLLLSTMTDCLLCAFYSGLSLMFAPAYEIMSSTNSGLYILSVDFFESLNF